MAWLVYKAGINPPQWICPYCRKDNRNARISGHVTCAYCNNMFFLVYNPEQPPTLWQKIGDRYNEVIVSSFNSSFNKTLNQIYKYRWTLFALVIICVFHILVLGPEAQAPLQALTRYNHTGPLRIGRGRTPANTSQPWFAVTAAEWPRYRDALLRVELVDGTVIFGRVWDSGEFVWPDGSPKCVMQPDQVTCAAIVLDIHGRHWDRLWGNDDTSILIKTWGFARQRRRKRVR